MTSAARPTPHVDRDSAAYWDALARRELVLQRCRACERHRFPSLPACPYSRDERADAVRARGTGALYSWIVVHRAFSPAFEADVPYAVGTVELDEGARMLGRVEAPGGGVPSLAAGLRVHVAFRDHAARGDAPAWTEAYFVAEGDGRG